MACASSHDLAPAAVHGEALDGLGKGGHVFRLDVHAESVVRDFGAELGARTGVDHGLSTGQVVADLRDDGLCCAAHEGVHHDIAFRKPRGHVRVVLVSQEAHGRAEVLRFALESFSVGPVSQDEHAQVRKLCVEQRCRFDKRREVVARAKRARVGDPQLVRWFFDFVGILRDARVEVFKVVAHVHRASGTGALAVLERTGGVFVARAHNGGTQVVDDFRVARERVECHIAHKRHVDDHAHGLGPEVVHVDDEGDARIARRLGTGAGDVVRRNLRVNQSVAPAVRFEVGAHVLRGDAVAANPSKVQVALVAGLVDEHHVVRKVAVARLRHIAVGLLPVLERRRDEVHVEAVLGKHLRDEPKARVTTRLVAELHAHGDDGDAQALALTGGCLRSLFHGRDYTARWANVECAACSGCRWCRGNLSARQKKEECVAWLLAVGDDGREAQLTVCVPYVVLIKWRYRENLEKGASMNTGIFGRSISWLLAMLLSFSLVPAWAEEAPAGDASRLEAGQSGFGKGAESAEAITTDSQDAARPAMSSPLTESSCNEDADMPVSDSLEGTNNQLQGAKQESASGSVEAAIPEGVYLIRSLTAKDKVLDVADGSLANSANVQLYTSNMTAGQRFRAKIDEQGFYVFVNENSGKVLDVADGRSVAGTNVQQYTENGTDGQKWRIVSNDDGSFSIESKLSCDLMLDVADGAGVNGANIQIYHRNGALAQRYEFVDVNPEVDISDTVSEGTYYLQSALSPSLFLGISNRGRDNGAEACLSGANSALSRQFAISMGNDGFATLRNVNSGRYLDAADGNLVPGTRVQLYGTEAVANAQKWAFRINDDETVTLVSKSSGLALDVCDAVADEGVRVQLYTPNGTAGQKWVLVPVERVLDNGLYSLSTRLDGNKCITTIGTEPENGARVQLWSNNNEPSQKYLIAWQSYSKSANQGAKDEAWAITLRPMTATNQYLTAQDNRAVTLERYSEGAFLRQLWVPMAAVGGGVAFENVQTGEMLDVSDAGTYDGCLIGTYPSNDTAGQAYYADIVDPIDQGTYIVQCVNDGRVLTVADRSRQNGANVELSTRDGSGSQAWIIEGIGGGYYHLINARSGKALDVADGVWLPQTNVQQYERNWSNAQKWYVVANEDGSYSFVSSDGDCALDAADGGGYDGANVQIYSANFTTAQEWRLIPTTYVPEDFEDCLGSFTTYSQNTWNGTYNMQKALDAFDGVVLQPGESMSFYGITGRCGAAEGYLPAGVVGGIGYGGGICQASTTIYGAAIRAGFEIVDRQNHSVPSVYVPIGLDAMVSWGYSDLVVRNTTDHPAKIRTYTYDNVLTCEIWGIQPEWYDYIEPISWYTSSSSAAAERIYYKDGSAVYTEQLPSSYYW